MANQKRKFPSYVSRSIEPANLRGFLTVQEEAARLGLKRQSIYHRLSTGKYYQAVQFGGLVMVKLYGMRGPLPRRGRRPVERPI